MDNNTAQPTAVFFLRARCLGANGSDREAEQRLIAAQRTACEQQAEGLGVQIIREYVECGGVGSIDKRPTLRLMLDELLALHDADYVIVTGLERLARNTDDMAAISLKLEAAGARVIIADSPFNTEHPTLAEYSPVTVHAGK